MAVRLDGAAPTAGPAAQPGTATAEPMAEHAGPADVMAVNLELAEVQRRLDGLRVRMRSAIDLMGALLLVVSALGLLMVTVLAVIGFVGGQLGIGMLFSSFVIISLPLVGFSAMRAFAPLWRLNQEAAMLRRREKELQLAVDRQVLRDKRDAVIAPSPREAVPTSAPPHLVVPSEIPSRAPTGTTAGSSTLSGRIFIPSASMPTPARLGWGVLALIGIFISLFAIGVIAGVLSRS